MWLVESSFVMPWPNFKDGVRDAAETKVRFDIYQFNYLLLLPTIRRPPARIRVQKNPAAIGQSCCNYLSEPCAWPGAARSNDLPFTRAKPAPVSHCHSLAA